MGYQPRVPTTGGEIETGLSSLLDHAAPPDRSTASASLSPITRGNPDGYGRIPGDWRRWRRALDRERRQRPTSEDGRPARAFVTSLDITLRVESKFALEAAKEKADEILASIGDGFYALDREWRFVYFNARAENFSVSSVKRYRPAIFRNLPDGPGFAGSLQLPRGDDDEATA